MHVKGQMLIQWMEQFAPKYLAVPDDKIGLQLGSLQKEIRNVLVALDVTEAVVDEAIAKDVNLIIAHHAIIFRPIAQLTTDTPMGKIYEKLIKNDIAVYIAHTNLDTAIGGVNDLMADALELTDTDCLEVIYTDDIKKLVVYVPDSDQEKVLQAMLSAGAGHIGNYSHCSFNSAGTGTFMPLEGTTPYIGRQGVLERVPEIRIEVTVPSRIERKVVQAMIKAHPYEEVAYDMYATQGKGKSYGLGRVGKLAQPLTLQQLVERVKERYDVPQVRVVGDLERQMHKVAVLGGSGARYVKYAMFRGADVLVTGDIDYHTAHDALAAGIALIDPGHNVEKLLKPAVAAFLQGKLDEKKYATRVYASQLSTEVFKFM